MEASVGNQGMYCQYVHRFLFVVLYKSMYIGAIALIFTANAIPSQNSRLVQTYSINVNQSHVQFFFGRLDILRVHVCVLLFVFFVLRHV